MKSINRLIFSILLLLSGGSLLLLIGYIARNSYQNWREREDLHAEHLAQYGAALMQSCENPPTQVNGDFPSLEQTPSLLILEAKNDYTHEWHPWQAPERYPTSAAAVDLVVCVDKKGEGQREQIEVCRYQNTDRTVTTYRINPTATVINARTGEVVAVTTLTGADPGCPYSIPVNYGRRGARTYVSEVAGGLPNPQVLINWIDGLHRQQGYQLAFDEATLSLCENPTPVAAAEVATPARLLLLSTGQPHVHDWFEQLPADLRADSNHLPELVICLGEVEYTTVPDCQANIPATAPLNEFALSVLEFQQASQPIQVIEVATGVTILSDTLIGTAPVCPLVVMPEMEPIQGQPPAYWTLRDWLEQRLGVVEA